MSEVKSVIIFSFLVRYSVETTLVQTSSYLFLPLYKNALFCFVFFNFQAALCSRVHFCTSWFWQIMWGDTGNNPILILWRFGSLHQNTPWHEEAHIYSKMSGGRGTSERCNATAEGDADEGVLHLRWRARWHYITRRDTTQQSAQKRLLVIIWVRL